MLPRNMYLPLTYLFYHHNLNSVPKSVVIAFSLLGLEDEGGTNTIICLVLQPASCLVFPPAKLIGRSILVYILSQLHLIPETAAYSKHIDWFFLLSSTSSTGSHPFHVHRVVGSAASLLCSNRQSPPGAVQHSYP